MGSMKNLRTHQLIRFLAIGSGVVVLSLAAPMLPHLLLQAYLRQKKFERKRFTQDLKRLKRRNLLEVRPTADGRVALALSKKGKKLAERYDMETLTIEPHKHWDGTWRLVMFDIPSTFNKARDALRRKLKNIGFYQLQKSVFLHPYPCEKEIDILGAYWGVRDFIVVMHVSHFEGEEKLQRYFSVRRAP
ncbi:MAG: hypothetical protein AAB581_01860 [Patescibacteria group bacterium]